MLTKIDVFLKDASLKFDEKEEGVFYGYASTFGNIDAVGDTILPGAYKAVVEKGRIIPMFKNHDSLDIPVGHWELLGEDETGLLVKGVIDMNHRDGKSLYSALKRKAMDALSIGFTIPEGGAKVNDDGVRELSEIDLKEISVVNFPADDFARVSAVKSIDHLTDLKSFENYLREAGFSKKMATAFVSQLKRLIQGEPEYDREQITKQMQRMEELHALDAIKQKIKGL